MDTRLFGCALKRIGMGFARILLRRKIIMGKSMNKVVLIGTVGRDPETKLLQSGQAVTKFSMATSHRVKKAGEWVEETDWHNMVLWGSENLVPYITKGSKLGIEGRISNRSYEDKEGKKVYTSEVVIEDVILCGNSQGGGGSSRQDRGGGYDSNSSTVQNQDFNESDDVPF